MENVQTEKFLLSRSIVDGEVIHETFGTRSFGRDKVVVKNAPDEDNSYNGPPNFSDEQKKRFVKLGLIPLSEIRYWLVWANKLTKESSKPFDINDYLKPGVDIDSLTDDERNTIVMFANARYLDNIPFDFPTGKAILGFLDVILNNYTDIALNQHTEVCPKIAQRLRKISAVPVNNYILFLTQFRSESSGDNQAGPDRTEIIQKLDEFVGSYMK